MTQSVLVLVGRGAEGGGTARPPGHGEEGKSRVLDIVRSGYVTGPAGPCRGGACIRLPGVRACRVEHALVGPADVG